MLILPKAAADRINDKQIKSSTSAHSKFCTHRRNRLWSIKMTEQLANFESADQRNLVEILPSMAKNFKKIRPIPNCHTCGVYGGEITRGPFCTLVKVRFDQKMIANKLAESKILRQLQNLVS